MVNNLLVERKIFILGDNKTNHCLKLLFFFNVNLVLISTGKSSVLLVLFVLHCIAIF